VDEVVQLKADSASSPDKASMIDRVWTSETERLDRRASFLPLPLPLLPFMVEGSRCRSSEDRHWVPDDDEEGIAADDDDAASSVSDSAVDKLGVRERENNSPRVPADVCIQLCSLVKGHTFETERSSVLVCD